MLLVLEEEEEEEDWFKVSCPDGIGKAGAGHVLYHMYDTGRSDWEARGKYPRAVLVLRTQDMGRRPY